MHRNNMFHLPLKISCVTKHSLQLLLTEQVSAGKYSVTRFCVKCLQVYLSPRSACKPSLQIQRLPWILTNLFDDQSLYSNTGSNSQLYKISSIVKTAKFAFPGKKQHDIANKLFCNFFFNFLRPVQAYNV
jgi:hypothetical protein